MSDTTTIISVHCDFRILSDDLQPTSEAKRTLQKHRELLEKAGITILKTLLVPGKKTEGDHIDIVIGNQDHQAAVDALSSAGFTGWPSMKIES